MRYMLLCAKMSKFKPNKRHLREVLLFAFNGKKSAAEARRMIIETYGEACIGEATCRDWFRRFKSGDFDVEDKERPGRVKKFENEELEALLDQDPCQTQEELANSLGAAQPTVSQRLKAIGMIKKRLRNESGEKDDENLGIFIDDTSKRAKK